MDQHLRALSVGQCAGNASAANTVMESYLQGKERSRSGSGGSHQSTMMMGSSSAKAQAQGLAQWGGHQQWGEVYSAAVAAAMVHTLFISLHLPCIYPLLSKRLHQTNHSTLSSHHHSKLQRSMFLFFILFFLWF